jgi:hypothetical protein
MKPDARMRRGGDIGPGVPGRVARGSKAASGKARAEIVESRLAIAPTEDQTGELAFPELERCLIFRLVTHDAVPHSRSWLREHLDYE